MSLWADYLNECGILHIVENDYGFITFHYEEPDILFVNDCYVVPSKRKSGMGSALVGAALVEFQDYGIKRLHATIHKDSEVFDETRAAFERFGFVEKTEDECFVLFEKLVH